MGSRDFDWERFQKHNNYSDADLESIRSDPRKAETTKKLFSREIAETCLVVEVVRSHGCTAGMKPGDRLVFKALGVLDPSRSSPWCANALGEIGGFAIMIHDRFVSGLDPNGMIYNHFSCMDAGCKCGWGQVIMKVFVAKDSELPAQGEKEVR